jgi:hypothetical protein
MKRAPAISVHATLLLVICIVVFACKNEPSSAPYHYIYKVPHYDLVQLQASHDTIHFSLNQGTYNDIKSTNTFLHAGKEYISFYDDRSTSVAIYDLLLQKLEKNISLKNSITNKKLYKTTVYIKNFDSIFIATNTGVCLMDSSGSVRKTIKFLKEPEFAWAQFENTAPAVFKKDTLYASVRPYVKETSLKALKNWKVLYAFDLRDNKPTLHYQLPTLYKQYFYGYRFLDYNYCYNNRGKFVFSFPADTLIYETDLNDYHAGYFGKSRYQQGQIMPVGKKALLQGNGSKEYSMRDSYGPIYFDASKKRYLRFAKQKISELDYNSKSRPRKESVIIFDENLSIIGECPWNSSISFNSIFLTQHGNIYARVSAKDEYALHYIRLSYKEDSVEQLQLTKK